MQEVQGIAERTAHRNGKKEFGSLARSFLPNIWADAGLIGVRM
jgi:hypothetical protein